MSYFMRILAWFCLKVSNMTQNSHLKQAQNIIYVFGEQCEKHFGRPREFHNWEFDDLETLQKIDLLKQENVRKLGQVSFNSSKEKQISKTSSGDKAFQDSYD